MSTILGTTKTPDDYFLEILFQDETGWRIQLPQKLSAYQGELELLIQKVFGNRPRSSENLALAKQLSMNWFFSKCRQSGIEVTDCF
jgi:hypothetical protein